MTTEEFRFYLLFRFYMTNPQHATTAEERTTITLLGETQALRVVGCNDPDEIDARVVWQHLQQYETAVGTTLRGGPLDSAFATRFRSLDQIDTQRHKDWRPVPAQLIANPCLTIDVSVVSEGS